MPKSVSPSIFSAQKRDSKEYTLSNCLTCLSPKPSDTDYPLSTTHYRSPDDSNCPLPLTPKRCVPLPALSLSSILLNPILAHSLNQPPIAFDLSQPSSTAILSPSFSSNTVTCTVNWRHQPAMYPATIGSLTLRFGHDDPNYPIWRPIVVFPVSPFDSVVTIDDVLKAVSRVVCIALREGRPNRSLPGRGLTLAPERSPQISVYDAVENDCVVWWGGFYPSTTERDVWMLDTRHEIRSSTADQVITLFSH